MKIIITESQFKRLIENIISESDSKINNLPRGTRRQEFIDILNKEDISYKIKDNKIIIGDDYYDTYLNLITYIPDNVEFNNNYSIWLSYVKEMGNNILFNNNGSVDLRSLKKMGNNIEFNNDGFVDLSNLDKMGDNIKFNNNNNVWLTSIFYFDINSVNFTNNVNNVYFGKSTYWMDLFPYELYKIKGKFKMWHDEKDGYEIIK